MNCKKQELKMRHHFDLFKMEQENVEFDNLSKMESNIQK